MDVGEGRTIGEGSDDDLAGHCRADGREVRRYGLDHHATLGGRPASTLDVQCYDRGDKAAGILSRGLRIEVVTEGSEVEYSVHVRVRGPEKEVSGDTPVRSTRRTSPGYGFRTSRGPGPDMRGSRPARPGAGRARARRNGSTPVTPPMPDPAEVCSGPSPAPAG
ncbi:hypothetical protein OG520_31795 [Streptomyces sp. NBC_00984]|uniref:hypothetical protein n=1 Tax=Streptomyces sp. NBC_00984 TaxID=2903700 RepID=UPI00386E7B1D|nr:hypothetical protein OG520_31795 [Streptomyces sp. NBC_00984]